MDLTKKESISSMLPAQHEEKFLVELFWQVATRLKSKYNYTEGEFLSIFNHEKNLVPAYIFSGNLSPAEALSKFLKENLGMDYSEISEVIGRDKKSVWANYKRAAKKMPWKFEIEEGISIPLSAFKKELSMLEGIVAYLKDSKKMKGAEIAKLLNKSPANIWTIHQRALRKNGKKQ